jgi:hypothetical protein
MDNDDFDTDNQTTEAEGDRSLRTNSTCITHSTDMMSISTML